MTLQEQVLKEQESQGISQNAIARSLDISASALSQWLKDKYKGNVEELESKVKSYLQLAAERNHSASSSGIPFQMTSIATRVFEVARLCHLRGDIGVVVGEAGLGKTMAVREYALRNRDVILIEADHGYTAKVVFQELCQKLGLEIGKQIHPMLEAVVTRLRGSGRMIIVDEAEHLPYKALELLRRVYDKAGIGLVLTGMPQLYRNIKGKRIDFAQLYSRVGVYTTLPTLKAKDVEKLVLAVQPSANGLCTVYAKHVNGNARRLEKLLSAAQYVAQNNGRPVTREMIDHATKLLVS